MASPHDDQPILTAGPDPRNASGTMILLHGRGAGARSMLALADALDVDGVAFLAPEAAGATWYPHSFLFPWEQNEPHVGSALAKVASVLQEVRDAGVPDHKIMLLGFSQGACLAAEAAARNADRFGAVFILTGGLIGERISPRATYTGSFSGCPILLACGDPDPHIPFSRVQETADVFRDMGGEVELIRYPGRPHTVSEDELDRVRRRVLQVTA
jgi:predicted esterase